MKFETSLLLKLQKECWVWANNARSADVTNGSEALIGQSVGGNFPAVYRRVLALRGCAARCLVAAADTSVARRDDDTLWISKLCGVRPLAPTVHPSINCSPAARLLAPRATDYLPADGEKFHAALARVITPIRGVMICVSAGAPRRLVQLREDESSTRLETTSRRQPCKRSAVQPLSSSAHPRS